MVRISGGVCKSVALVVPRRIRATESRVRQALGNILRDRLPGARMIDGCAGSGAVGCEALSHGASWVAFLEQDPVCLRAIRANLARMGASRFSEGQAELFRGDICRTLKRLARRGVRADLVWVDPPYESDLGRKVLQAVVDCAILAPSGIVCVEHAHRTRLPASTGFLRRQTQHRYGGTVLSFYAQDT